MVVSVLGVMPGRFFTMQEPLGVLFLFQFRPADRVQLPHLVQLLLGHASGGYSSSLARERQSAMRLRSKSA